MKPVITRLPLRVFQIIHPCPLELTHADIEALLRLLGPTLETLVLNPAPQSVVVSAPTLQVSVLNAVARYCRVLRHLAIYLDATTIPAIPQTPFSLPPGMTIDFGKSPVKNQFLAANFLATIGSPRVKASGTASGCGQWAEVVDAMDMMWQRFGEITSENQRLREEAEMLYREKEEWRRRFWELGQKRKAGYAFQ